jgi:hypothetical protein
MRLQQVVLWYARTDRLTETIIPSPFTEFRLADHRRFNPVTTFHFGGGQPLVPTAPTNCREVEKGALFNPNLVQIRKETETFQVLSSMLTMSEFMRSDDPICLTPVNRKEIVCTQAFENTLLNRLQR